MRNTKRSSRDSQKPAAKQPRATTVHALAKAVLEDVTGGIIAAKPLPDGGDPIC